MKVTKCGGCGAKIIWIKNHLGNKTPVDANPRRLYVMTKGHPKDVGGLFDSDETVKWGLYPCYTPHHQTCPEVQRYRDKKKGEKSPALHSEKGRKFWEGV